MKLGPGAVAVIAAAAVVAGSASAAPLSNVALAQAARDARLAVIDPSGEEEHGDATIGTWLTALVGAEAASIRWSGGRCRLVRTEVARDSGGPGARCGHATIRLKRPQGARDVPLIEVYFDRPITGRAPKPYAFRGVLRLGQDEDYTRFTRDFAAGWRERFATPERRP